MTAQNDDDLQYTSLFIFIYIGVSNEARFVFTVQSIVMSQKLKGTLTFIVKVSRRTYHD